MPSGNAATANDLKQIIPTKKISLQDLAMMSDFRYKGYVNDFMVSPRNPITQRSSPVLRAIMHAPVPVRTPQKPAQTQSAELRVRKQEADREIAAFKKERLNEMLQSEELKKQELEYIKQYQPFGKPGAGAPVYYNYHNRQKFTEYDTDTYSREQTYIGDDQIRNMAQYNPMESKAPNFRIQQPGHSALDRTMEDTQARIEKLKQEIDSMNTIPYIDPVGGHVSRPPPGKQKPFQFYDPWGKGQGNPRRRSNGELEGYNQIREQGIVPPLKEMARSWPESRVLSTTEEPVPIPIAQKQQSYSPSWDSKISNGLSNSVGTGLNTDSRYGGGGSVVKTDSGSQRTRFPTTMRKDIYGNSSMTELDGYNPFKSKAPENPNYFPFGKPGGGAPVRDHQGKLAVQRRNLDFAHELDTSADIHKRRKAADTYLQELKREMEVQRRSREEANVDAKAPIGELASLVRQGKVGFPKRDPQTGLLLDHRHKFSDITKVQVGLPDSKKFAGVVGEDDLGTNMANAKQYHNDLSRLAEERHRMRQLERMRDQQEEVKHGETWKEFWGKPGAGAPNSKDPDVTFRRPKFDEVLHHPENRSGLIFIKNTPHGIKQLYPAHYNKSTIHSNHSNMFELPVESAINKNTKGEYKLISPFATLLPF